VIIIVIDDASPSDFVKNICNEFKDRVVYMRNEYNLGISKNFNRAIQVSKTDFVQIIGQDDLLTGSMMSVLPIAAHFPEDCFGVQAKVGSINKNSRKSINFSDLLKKLISPKQNAYLVGDDFQRRILLGNWVYFPAVIWNKNIVDKYSFSSEYKYCMDLEFLLRVSADGFKFLTSSCGGFSYRRHRDSESMSAPPSLRLNEEISIIRRYSSGWQLKNVLIRSAILPRANFLMSKFIELGKITHS
jgi:GT2 family glycosyltransferase